MNTHHTKKNKISDSSKILIVALLIVNLLLTIYVGFFKRDAVWLETLKSGGSDNFKLVQELYTSDSYKDQQTQTLNQILWSMGDTDNTAGAPTDTAPSNDADVATLDKDTIDSLLKDVYIQWKEDARYLLIEYSDLLCPFCQRHYNDQTLEKVVAKYPNDVALVFKNMPLVQLHPTAPLGAEAVECAGKLWGSDAFYEYLSKAFQENSFDNTNIVSIAKEIGLNTSKFESCIKNGEFTSKVNGNNQEAGTVFWIGGTPGNVILDRETGKYIVVSGAYPFEKFDTELQNLMD